MRRQLAIAALCTGMLAIPAGAQMHGGSRGGGAMGRGGFASSGSVGFRGGSSFGVAPRSGMGFSTGFRQPAFRSGQSFIGIRQPFFGPRHFPGQFFPGPFFGARRFRRPIFFSSFYSPFFFGYFGNPYYDSSYSYVSADYYPGYDYSASANAAQNDIAQQQQDINRLEDEVGRLRDQRDYDQRDSREADVPSKSIVSTPTLLVFRDKHTQEVQNYAIVGGTLWIFSEQKATKLPLSWLDIDATARVNDERGINFQVPKSQR